MKFKLGWYVLYVKSRWEKKVHDSLEEISIEPFLPKIKTIQQWSDRKKTILKPLFPSYVFVNIKSSLDFHKALSVDGACCYIRFGKEYARVLEKEIDQVKLLVNSKEIDGIELKPQLPKIGEIKKITQGPLNGLNCEIIRADNYNKIIVRISSLRQNIIATIPLNSFKKAV
ncbi:UpxY family transcription antiterminator [Kordia sp. YSTF-M3]|uniref:UpxY family transcription antiterminator n=1 Tax=Kordia aestuariivivens TaxID=2759037 RepID=A0ABR7QER5_9FLAO|nr:UpxY family transcription antiterminator [Kordia aestuariivivens]MBC8757065.1 UpxY family transcription antiterminator [Kordia aestuariivivens]